MPPSQLGPPMAWTMMRSTNSRRGPEVVPSAGQGLASTPEDRVANHALDNNATSIGIELVHEGDGVEPFGKPQIDALIGLLKSIRSRYEVPIENIKSHSEVDVRTFRCGGGLYRTKLDPGANFPWGRVRAAVRNAPALTAKPASPPQHRTR